MVSLDPITGVLGRKAAAHFLRRVTFGASKQQIDTFAGYSIDQAVSAVLVESNIPSPPKDKKTGATWLNPKPGLSNSGEEDLRDFFKSWVLESMAKSGSNAVEKLTFFLHTHFTTIQSVVDQSSALYYQYLLLKKYTFGNLKELAEKICKDNAMLILLDGSLNVSGRPNENFAREFFELYTIGRGKEIGAGNYTNYTESDIREAARVLSGWAYDSNYTTIDASTGVPSGKLKLNSSKLADKHDPGVKTFSSAFQNKSIAPSALSGSYATEAAATKEITELVEMIFAQPETARFFCRKLYRFYIFYKISEEVEENIIKPLAENLVANNFQIKPLVEKLFKSKHFFDQDNTEVNDNARGALIKSPLDISIGMLKFFKVEMPSDANLTNYYGAYGELLSSLRDQGMDYYEPLDVAGYDAYHEAPNYNRNWISANFLARRYEFAALAIKGIGMDGQPPLFKIDVMKYITDPVNVPNPSDATQLAKDVIELLLPEAITEERFNYFLNILLDNLSTINWEHEWENYISSKNDMGIRTQLEDFFNAVLQSPEYQLL
ncbi:MAG TPA: DUF1800 family protein [Cytophagaceae bacterium]|jgi:uncharacterized protein (DUF1800 family)